MYFGILLHTRYYDARDAIAVVNIARTVSWMPRNFVWTPELHPRFCVFQSFIPKDFLDFGAPSADRPSKAVFSRVYFLNAVTYV